MIVVERTAVQADPGAPPRWGRPALWVLLAVTALLYLWALGSAGWANEYYAAAVQAGTQNWKAMLFGSLDAGNAITVDKPPAALWLMALSGRFFAFNSWSMLVPQALMGVAAVALLHGAVRRVSGPGAGLLAGAVLALTPVAALMFRFNNPDALLVLLLVVAGYCVIRALDGGATGWIALAGFALGLGFLTKLMQALLVAPGLALAVLVAMPGGVWRRIRLLAVGLAATVAGAGWFVALVSLWPADSRPYIGGSTDNSLLQLALGYNGLGRVFGGNGNHVGPPPGGADMPAGAGGPGMFGGEAGISRLFAGAMGTEASWLLPAALIALVAGLFLTRRALRTDPARAALLLWGGWLLVTALIFSYMKGIMHPYYTVALTPALAAVVAIGVTGLWREATSRWAGWVLAGMVAVTGVWDFVLLARTPEWLPWLRWMVLAGAVVVAALLLVVSRPGAAATALAVVGLVVGLAGPAVFTIATVAGEHTGSIPSSGPHRTAATGPPGFPGPRADNPDLDALVRGAENRWAAATVGSHGAVALELATGRPVMSIGGFNGSDPAPTLGRFRSHVAAGEIHYFVAGTGPGGDHGPERESPTAREITEWVRQNYRPQKVGDVEVYDLSR